MKNKYDISDNLKKLMSEVENPQRPPSKWWEGKYDWKHYEELLEAVFSDFKDIASRYGITLDEAWFRNHVEYIAISVRDYTEQKTFLKELVMLGSEIWNDYNWRVKGYNVQTKKIKDSIRGGLLAALAKSLEDFVKEEREKNIYVDGILIDNIMKHLQGEELDYPKGFLSDGRPYYKEVEDYLCYSVDFSYLEHGRCSAAQSLAYCVLGKDNKKGWNLSINEGAFIYDLLYYCGYVSREQMEDKNNETYSEKHKYDMVKPYFK